MKKSSYVAVAILVGLITNLFIALKVMKLISWSWWFILSPIWIVILLVLLIICLAHFIERTCDYNND